MRPLATALVLAVLSTGCFASYDSSGPSAGALGASTCEDFVTPIYAGRTIEAGSVTVSNTATDLVVVVSGSGDWLVGAVHLYAGTGPVPTNAAGNPAPGRFPYHQELDPPVTSTVLTVPLSDLAVGCDDTLTIAVHTEMVRVVDGVVVAEETGWGFGPTPHPGRQWGWSFSYTICCADPGCTYTQGYWKNHESAWPVASLELGSQTYTQAELLALLRTPATDASLILAHQLIAAKLNVAAGAATSAAVAAAIADADAWMIANADADGRLSYGTAAGSSAHVAASALADALAAFNQGESGTPHCDD